ncbi:hypothetical protein FN846DRAFT_947732, partial [Sphaerosporella brunnea]
HLARSHIRCTYILGALILRALTSDIPISCALSLLQGHASQGCPALIVASQLPDSPAMDVTAGVSRIALVEADGDSKKADPKLSDLRRPRQSSIPIPERCSSDRHKLSCPNCRIKEDIAQAKITPPAPAEKLVVKKTRAFKEGLVGGRHTAARALARRVSTELLAARKFEAEREAAAEAQRLAGKGAKRNSLSLKGY